uniref:Uncharacterized protein n=1 Tax=Amphimedon queenslandica TaxID=400682 RepID=A0A1X7TYY5_AMPQE
AKCTFAEVKPPSTPTEDEDIKPAIIPPILPDADDKDIEPVIIPPILPAGDDKDIKPAIIPPIKPTNATGRNYYNCTVNMFHSPQPLPYYYPPWSPHYPYSCDSSLSHQFA